MAKVYLFRNLESELNQQQSEICAEAISSILDDVFKGNTSTIFTYCNWPVLCLVGDQCDKRHMLGRILNKLFQHVYAMEVTMELNICINHLLFNIDGSPITTNQNRDHFVASPIAAYLYMKRIINQQLLLNKQKNNSHVRFTICVRQTNLEQSLNLNGKLQIYHLKKANDEKINKIITPMTSLLKMICILAKSEKTHLRYYNIRLEALLKKMLGSKKCTVIIHYTLLSQQQQHKVALSGCAKLWKALFKHQFRMFKSLNQQLLGLQFLGSNKQKLELNNIVDMLNKSDGNGSMKLEVRKRVSSDISYTTKSKLNEKSPNAYEELEKIKVDAKVNVEKILELQSIVEKLALDMEQNEQQLEEKNKEIERLNGSLANTNKELEKQRIVFQRNLNFYSEMFKKLWRQQSNTLKLQEQQRDEQLSEMFDTMCKEMHRSLLPHLVAQSTES